MTRKFVDLSIFLENDVMSDPPAFAPKIQYFTHEQTYEQMSLPHAALETELPYMQPSTPVQLLFVGGQPSGVQLPSSIELSVTDTEPGVKGDTVSNVTKPATLETGAVVAVPLFVNVGDRIKVDPREGRYISRA